MGRRRRKEEEDKGREEVWMGEREFGEERVKREGRGKWREEEGGKGRKR
jgi:hypothetical protein